MCVCYSGKTHGRFGLFSMFMKYYALEKSFSLCYLKEFLAYLFFTIKLANRFHIYCLTGGIQKRDDQTATTDNKIKDLP